MFNPFNCKRSFPLTLFRASSKCVVLFKMMVPCSWITIILFPCLGESNAFAFRQGGFEFPKSDHMFLESTLKHRTGINIFKAAHIQDGKFVIESFPQIGRSIVSSSDMNQRNGESITDPSSNNRAENSTADPDKCSNNRIRHLFYGAFLGAGIFCFTLWASFSLWFYFTQRRNKRAAKAQE